MLNASLCQHPSTPEKPEPTRQSGKRSYKRAARRRHSAEELAVQEILELHTSKSFRYIGPAIRREKVVITPASSDVETAFVNRPVGQIGIVVRDLEAACRQYSALWANGPWRCYTYSPAILARQTYRGAKS